jgi:HlyD family secretion protein
VLKIEPLATVSQNVTMFPVLVRIQNRDGLLKPGMNSEVEIHVGRREGVLAVPNGSLRTTRDVSSAAQVLGLTMSDVQAELAKGDTANAATTTQGGGGTGAPAAANTLTLPDGRTVTLPAGVTEAQIKAIFAKRQSGREPTAEERALLRRVFAGGDQSAGGGRPKAQPDTRFGGRYIVFVSRGGKPIPVNVRTGLTDLDYTEVVSGLTDSDSVLVLPSASLVQSQQEFKDRVSRVSGTGIPGMQAQPSSGSKAPTTRP